MVLVHDPQQIVRDAKKRVHLLETHPFGLGDEEKGKEEGERTSGAEEKPGVLERINVSKGGRPSKGRKRGGFVREGIRTKPMVLIMVSVVRAMTKLISHCVAAARPTLSVRSRAVGISDT